MCIIVAKPKGVKLKKEVWAECFRCNGHGAGLTYVDGDELVVDKGFFEFEDIYPEIEKHEDLEMIVHFRIASAGVISFDNCHPFFYQSKMSPQYSFAIAHNGTLEWRSTKEESDTNCFVNDLLGPHLDRDPYFLDSATGKVMLTHFIGSRNKLAIMRYDSVKKETKTYIINKSAGTEDLGVWFSNYSYRVVVSRPYNPGAYGYNENYERAYGDDYSFSGNAFDRKFTDTRKDWSKYGYTKHPTIGGAWVPSSTKPLNVIKVDAKTSQQEKLKLDGNINITVPRDADMEARLQKELRRDSRLEHLSKKGRKIFRRMAFDFAKATVKDYQRLTAQEKIADFRQEFKWQCKDQDVWVMSEECLDRYIVDKYVETGSFPNFMVTPSEGDITNAKDEMETEDNPPLNEQSKPIDLLAKAAELKAEIGAAIEQFPS